MEERQVPFVYGGELKKYFQLYMTQVLGRKDSTANHYLQALNTISKYMRQLNLVNKDVFELGSLEELHRAWDKLEQDSVFSHLNQKGHNMYSAGFQRYLEFAAGHSFGKLATRYGIDQASCAVNAWSMPIINASCIQSIKPSWQRAITVRTWRCIISCP